MKRQPRRAGKKAEALRIWTFGQAQAAVPYITSIVRSLREYGLEILAQQRLLKRLEDQPGRADRDTLIARQEARDTVHRLEEQFHTTAEELHGLDIYSLDPLQGQALVPFIHNDQLAWYIFDLFDSQPFRFWRYQSDPDDTRRPLTARQKGLTGSSRGF